MSLKIDDTDPCYSLISNMYGSKRAKRSGVLYMNHIDEGLFILSEGLGANQITQRAFVLHPLFQEDAELARNLTLLMDLDSLVVALIMEYRSVANEYMSSRHISYISEIRLSPLEYVNQMLIADKVQNRKDFEKYHKGNHLKSDALDLYFDNWLERLEVTENDYRLWVRMLEKYSNGRSTAAYL